MSAPFLNALKPVAVSADDVAVGQIAPAMRTKLRADGRLWGMLVGLLSLGLVYSAEPVLLRQLFGSNLHHDLPQARLVADGIDLLGLVLLFALPAILGRLTLSRELRYRRRRGKWRWE